MRRFRFRTLCAIAHLVVFATVVPVSAALSVPAPTPEVPKEMTFKGENNLVIEGLFYSAPQTPAPTVILLNFRTRWSDWAPMWSTRGFNVVAIDLLIYNVGGSLDATIKQDVNDILLVMDQLNSDPAVIPHQFALIGGSLMGGDALVTCSKAPDCKTAILLSPTPTVESEYSEDPMVAMGNRPIMIVASRGEGIIADTARDYAKRARGYHLLLIYDWGFHATAMFYAHPELVDTVGDWLVTYLLNRRGSPLPPSSLVF
ncbi:MAG TPA: hypothetical protein VKQ72_20130 [Aggregatilineales bacterium]|nr:hypothetical protein [Aggregatilineales bacterium]